jgi:hypothetical protein
MNEQTEFYINQLKEYPGFSDGKPDAFLEFQDSNDEILVKLKKDFNIADITAGSNDFEKALSLMNYIHNELFFARSNAVPSENNTYGIMKVRKTGSLFCSYQATVLCEMLLAARNKSKQNILSAEKLRRRQSCRGYGIYQLF